MAGNRGIEILKAALKLFSTKGFYATTMPEIAKSINMSSGNIYNYYSSKELLAKEIMKYSSEMLGGEIKKINDLEISSEAKITKIVATYFDIACKNPEHVNYFLRVYLSNHEVFKDGCEKLLCVSPFVTEIMVFFEEGVRNEELRDQDFFSAFGLFMGYLGGFAFLNGESVLPEKLDFYIEDISRNIFNALKA